MSVPTGHTAVGWAAAEALPDPLFERWWQTLLLVVVVANLPDLDLAAGLLVGDPDRWHHGPSHSVGAALVAGLAGGAAGRAAGRGFGPAALLVGTVYLSHVLLDLVTPQRASVAAGVELLWPVSSRTFALPVPVPDPVYQALMLDLGGGPKEFLLGIVGPEMLVALATELLLFLPFVLAAVALRSFRS